MVVSEAARCVLEDYPKIFFACHRRHVRDPKTQQTLSAHQASILDHLDEVEPLGLNALAAHMGVTASTMSLNIDRLVEQGYVVRQRDKADARRVGLRLSAAGTRIKEAQSVLDPDRLNAVLKRLTAKERDDAIRGLGLLARASREHMEQQPREGRWWGESNEDRK